MSTLCVPLQYPSIQSALDAAQCDDTIVIETGIYEESLEVIGKNNLRIKGNGLVILDGTELSNIGIIIEGNNICISDLQITHYTYGVSIRGCNNVLKTISVEDIEKDGFFIDGNRNQLISSSTNQCGHAGVLASGNHNLFLANQFSDSSYGILMTSGSCVRNIIDRNLFICQRVAAIALTSPCCDRNIILHNEIQSSQCGIKSHIGQCAVIGNSISGCCNEAMQMNMEESLVILNVLLSNNIGMKLRTCGSIISENTIQDGHLVGLLIVGNKNNILKNIIYGYDQVGLLINGRDNYLEANSINQNETDLLDDSTCNTYCQVNNCCSIDLEECDVEYDGEYSRYYDRIVDLLDHLENVLKQYGLKVEKKCRHKRN